MTKKVEYLDGLILDQKHRLDTFLKIPKHRFKKFPDTGYIIVGRGEQDH